MPSVRRASVRTMLAGRCACPYTLSALVLLGCAAGGPATPMAPADPSALAPPFEVGPKNLVPLYRTAPVYPVRAEEAGTQGWVMVRYAVGPDGRATKLRVVESQPAGVFDAAALAAVSQWIFRRPIRNGRPTTSLGHFVRLTFLQD